MNSISEIRRAENSSVLRASSQITLKNAMIEENLKLFILACSSQLFYLDSIRKFRLKGENSLCIASRKGIVPKGIEEDLGNFL